MRTVLLLLLFCLGNAAYAQVAYDSLIIGKLNEEKHAMGLERKKKGVAFAMLNFYKRNISDQIINDCIYEVSCSEFSRQLFANYGTFKGVFLTLDRLSRCNRLSYQDVPLTRRNAEGKIIDHWEDYQIGR